MDELNMKINAVQRGCHTFVKIGEEVRRQSENTEHSPDHLQVTLLWKDEEHKVVCIKADLVPINVVDM